MSSVKLFTTNRSSLKLVELARHSPLGSIAQSVERRTGIPKVRVQIPLGPTTFPLASQYRFIMFNMFNVFMCRL